jgi:diaminopropionate ammonia-lyase
VISDTSYPGYMDIPCMVMQGYEVMAAEAFDGLAEPPTQIFLQTGVGGMAAAVAAQAKRRWGEERPMIILADPENAACWVESFRAGQPTTVGGDLDTMMAGLACGEVSLLAWKILKDHGDAAIAIPDNTAFEFMRRLARPSGSDPTIVAGESAVAGLAGVFAAKELLGLNAQSHALVFGTEGATDPDLYQRIVGADRRLSRSAKIEC